MEWQPIRTAPKDETEVLLYLEDYSENVSGVFVGYYERKGFWRSGSDGWRWYPTHWMPLPKPPNVLDESL